MGEQEESICLNGNGGKEKMDPIGSCDPYSLVNLFCGLPDEKKSIIRAMGFAPLVDMPAHHLRGVVVRWMIEQYNTVVDKVNMNGCMLSITSRDVEDLLGFIDGGEEVEDYGCMEDIEGVRQRYGKMTKKELAKGIVNTSIDGLDVLNFKCLVVLYVLQVYLCPTTHRTPKRFMLHILKQTEKKSNLNWAKFLLMKLKSGIANYKSGKKKIVEGCTHLLMVFFLERSGGLCGDGKKPSWESWTEKKVQMKVYQDLFFLQRRPSTMRVNMNGFESNMQSDVVEMRREIGEMKNLLNLVLKEVKEIREEIIVVRDNTESKHRMVSPCTATEDENDAKGLTECDGDTSSVGSMQETKRKEAERRSEVDESVVAELLKNIKHQFPMDVLTMRDAPFWQTWKGKKSRFGETHKERVGGVANGSGRGKVKGKRKRRDEEDRGVDDVEREEEELRKAQEGKTFGGEGIGTENVVEDDPGHATIMAMAKMVEKQVFDANDMPTTIMAMAKMVEGPDRWTRSVTSQPKTRPEASTSAQVHTYQDDDSGARNLFLAPAFMQSTPAALELPGKSTKGWVAHSTSLLQRDVYRLFLEQQRQAQWMQYMTEVLWMTATQSGCKIPPPPPRLNVEIPEHLRSSFLMSSSVEEEAGIGPSSTNEGTAAPENEKDK